MKVFTAIILTIATLAAAAPSPNGDATDATLVTRQECVYSCGCQTQGDDSGVDPDTATCCSSVGGTLGNEGSVRLILLCLCLLLAARKSRVGS
jgi:hypothetical protein